MHQKLVLVILTANQSTIKAKTFSAEVDILASPSYTTFKLL